MKERSVTIATTLSQQSPSPETKFLGPMSANSIKLPGVTFSKIAGEGRPRAKLKESSEEKRGKGSGGSKCPEHYPSLVNPGSATDHNKQYYKDIYTVN